MSNSASTGGPGGWVTKTATPATTTTAANLVFAPDTWDNPAARPTRRGQTRRIAIVWLEREDERAPAQWADSIMHRFFDPQTASWGVLLESPDIPWETPAGHQVRQFSSFEELDATCRRHQLERIRDAAKPADEPAPISLGGIPVTLSQTVPSNSMYLLNTKYLRP